MPRTTAWRLKKQALSVEEGYEDGHISGEGAMYDRGSETQGNEVGSDQGIEVGSDQGGEDDLFDRGSEDELDGVSEDKLGGGSEDELGGGSEDELGGGSEDELGRGSEDELGGGSEDELDGGSEDELDGGSEDELDGGSEDKLGGGSEDELGGGSEDELDGGSEDKLGRGSEDELGGGSEDELGGGSEDELGGGSEDELDGGSEDDRGSEDERSDDEIDQGSGLGRYEDFDGFGEEFDGEEEQEFNEHDWSIEDGESNIGEDSEGFILGSVESFEDSSAHQEKGNVCTTAFMYFKFLLFPLVEFDARPLYAGAPLSKGASWLSIYQYAVSNRLTDTAIQQLLELIRVHCPPSNLCPPSLYKLKKQLGQMEGVVNLKYCSICMQEVSELKQCPKSICKRKKAQICYFSILPFENHLCDIFSGILPCNLAMYIA